MGREKLEKSLKEYVESPHTKLDTTCLSVLEEDAYHLLTTIRRRNNRGHTAVYLAAVRDHQEALTSILDSVTDEHKYDLLKIQTVDGTTPLHDATFHGLTDIVKHIFKSLKPKRMRYQLLKIKAMYGYTPLHYAAWRGHTDIITPILESVEPAEQRKLLKIRSDAKETALELAQRWENVSTAEAIKEYKNNETPGDGKNFEFLVKRNS